MIGHRRHSHCAYEQSPPSPQPTAPETVIAAVGPPLRYDPGGPFPPLEVGAMHVQRSTIRTLSHANGPLRSPLRIGLLLQDGGIVLVQNPLTFSRPPVTVFPDMDAVATAALRMASLTCNADAPERDAA